MKIKSIEIKNFLSIKDAKLDCTKITTLVGANGVGKSNFLRALGFFYSLSESKSITKDKWFLDNIEEPIQIILDFAELKEIEKQLLGKYVKNNTLKVKLEINYDKVSEKATISYHGRYLQHPLIHNFRKLTKSFNATKKKEEYEKLREHIPDLLEWTRADAMDDKLSEWESQNQNICQDLDDDGKFFGFTEVGNGNLKLYTRFLYLPAVRDASEDAIEGAGSLLNEIAEILKKKVKASNELKQLEENFRNEYETKLKTESENEIKNVNEIISADIKRFLPEYSVNVGWGKSETKTQLGKLNARLTEIGMENFNIPIVNQGHGVQRIYILTLLKVVNELRKEVIEQQTNDQNSEADLQPDLIIGIEEPELYQHPLQQRNLYRTFKKLTQDSDEQRNIQILYSTHSPNFIDVEDFGNLKLIKKIDKETQTKTVSKEIVNQKIAYASEEDVSTYTADGLDARLSNIMNSIVNEGFFAKELVLVEGLSDVVFIDWLIDHCNKRKEFEMRGIAVIPVFGKNNLVKPIVIFDELGIKTYFIFDGDKSEKKEKDSAIKANKILLTLGNSAKIDFPLTTINEYYTCFEDNLEKELENKIGSEIWNDSLTELKNNYGLDKDQAKKNPIVMRQFYEKAKEKGAVFSFFESIIENILKV